MNNPCQVDRGTRPLLTVTRQGIHCPEGDFYIDPWRPVARAIITHGHADHARAGHASYLAHPLTAAILRQRLSKDLVVQSLEYGKTSQLGPVTVSLHPAGHIPGSAQIRVAHRGQVWVVTGDYKIHPDGLSTPWEPVPCHTLITESTFGLPVYRWPDPGLEMQAINHWWQTNREAGRVSVLLAYSLGKAQRLLFALDRSIGDIRVHPAIRPINDVYRRHGLPIEVFPEWRQVASRKEASSLLILPPAAFTEWTLKDLGPASIAQASGWMCLRGRRRRMGLDRGFVLSDHADWDGLNQAIQASGAERVLVTHGQVEVLVRWLREQGLEAHPVTTEFGQDSSEVGDLPQRGQP